MNAEEEGQPFLPTLHIIPTTFHHIQVAPFFFLKTLKCSKPKIFRYK